MTPADESWFAGRGMTTAALENVESEARAVVEDSFALDREIRPWDNDRLLALADVLARSTAPVVYTAFDGDHFGLAPQMRHSAMGAGYAPANPESILGYKQAVDAHQSKKEVLLDDLAVVQRSDALWVFTDVDPTPTSVAAGLAEGAVLELLWFLKSRPGLPVHFVPTSSLFGQGVENARYRADLHETELALHQSGLSEIVRLVAAVLNGESRLRPIVYFLHDPLDGKYVDWLRAGAYARSHVPIVPSLAVELRDASGLSLGEPFAATLAAWVSLMTLADEAWHLPPHDSNRLESPLVRLLRLCWETTKASTVRNEGWAEYQIPKTLQGGRWPVSRREGAE